jgi:hypothetical protein
MVNQAIFSLFLWCFIGNGLFGKLGKSVIFTIQIILDSMKKPPKQHSDYCLNCHYPLSDKAIYCHKCSQKVTDGRVTFSEMVSEFFGAVFNFDSRFFQTIAALFVPGKLTTEYFKGRHRRFVHPLRVFLVMTLALVAVITLNVNDSLGDSFEFGTSLEKRKERVVRYEMLQEMDSLKQQTAAEFNNLQVTAGLDTLFDKMMHGQKTMKKDSVDLDAINFSDKDKLRVATDDLLNLTVKEILDKYEVEGYWKRLDTAQEIRLLQDNQNFGLFLLRNVSWMMFFMMPFLALILKLLYIRRQYYYVEHLIFSFHTHAFVFLVYILMLLSDKYEVADDWSVQIGIIAICGYLYWAMYRVYQQGWFKTLLKYIVVGIFYFFILLVASLATLLVSFALF